MSYAITFDSDLSGGKTGMDPRLGHIRGKVLDMDGDGIRHSCVWIRETGRCAYTDENGNFVLVNVSPGMYSLIAESEGYSQSVFTDVPVEAGDNPGHIFVMYPQYAHSRVGRRRGALAFQD
jgi:protocatechuate 3,4-dioxygenase beta subunit